MNKKIDKKEGMERRQKRKRKCGSQQVPLIIALTLLTGTTAVYFGFV